MTESPAVGAPFVLVNTASAIADAGDMAAGAIWRLTMDERELDANLVALPAGESVAMHAGADLDVLMHVLAGGGVMRTDAGDLVLEPGALLWLPPRSRRAIEAGDEGLRYLTVHRRRQSLVIGSARPT